MVISGRGQEGLFTAEEVVRWMQKFLENAGYRPQPTPNTGPVQPGFHAKRQTDHATHELLGIACQSIDDAPDGLAGLKALKASIGDQSDYVLVFPPVSEHLTIEFLTKDRGKYYFDIKQEGFMLWICNPERETTTCLIGGPQDPMLNQRFVRLGMMSFDAYISMRLSQVIMAEEEEEEIAGSL